MSIVENIVGALIQPVTGLISEFIEDKDKAARLAFEVSTLAANQAHAETLAQIEVNKTEAATGNMFIAGWRPGMGWTCGSAYFLAYVGLPMLSFVAALFGHTITPPAISFAELSPVLFGMLGLGAFRSLEKVKGVAS